MPALKLVLAHPGVGPFVQQTARALFESGLLHSYWTTFVDQPSAIRRTLASLAAALGWNVETEFGRRAIREIPDAVVRAAPFWEIVRSVLARANADARLVDIVWEHEVKAFDRRVARRALQAATGIYGYEYSALATFKEARRRGLPRIYEVPSPEHDFVEGLIQREIDRFPELDDGSRRYFRNRQTQRTARRRAEWELADIVIANSTFTRDTYQAAGLDVAKVHVVPLGAPPVCGSVEGGSGAGPKMRVLYAGSFSIRKGAHYLLSAWSALAPTNARLEVFGANQLPYALKTNLPASVSISPTIPASALAQQYQEADVLVFPTLCDGFGMVITEAFAHGLPVVTTRRAGASDLVRHGENGLIVEAGDPAAIVDALEWCLAHRVELKRMRKAALETAARWQWSDYRRALSQNLINRIV